MPRFDSCPCCGGREFYDFYSNPEHEAVTTPHEFAYGGSRHISRLVKCRRCAYAFNEDACEEYSAFYSMDQTTVVNETQAGKKKYFQSVIKRADGVLEKSAGGMSLVDIGAGNGAFVSQLVASGFNGVIDAVELNDQSKTALSSYVRNVYSTIEEIKDAETRYDFITMFDFLEHVEDPRAFLVLLQNISHENTIHIIGVPRMDSMISRILGHKYWLYTPMHYSYFSRKSLQALLGGIFGLVSIRKSPWETGPLSSALKWLGINLELSRDISITVPHSSSYICVCRDRISPPGQAGPGQS